MIYTFEKSELCGTVQAIRSKSAAHRLLIAAALADGPTYLYADSTSEDIDATVRCLTALGAEIRRQPDGFAVTPIQTVHKGATLDVGESGSTLRFLLPVTAALAADASFVRKGRLADRPLSPLYEELARNGVLLPPDPKTEPLPVGGRLLSGAYTLDGSISSQFVSGLLLSMPKVEKKSSLTLTGTVESAPYIRMTLSAMAAFGAAPRVSADGRIYTAEALTYRTPGALWVEGDWSNAALWLCAGAMGKTPVTVTGLSKSSPQGDRQVLSILSAFGATVTEEEDRVTVTPGALSGISFDAAQIPDLVPVLAAVAVAAEGETVITGIRRLRLKESDRAAAVGSLISTLGGHISTRENAIHIWGGAPLTGGTVSSFGDHRMVMCAALLSILAKGSVSVTGSEAIRKSYPGFAADYKKLGGILTESEDLACF